VVLIILIPPSHTIPENLSVMSLLQLDSGRKNEYGQKTEKSLGKSKQKTSNEHLIPLLALFHWTGCSQELVTFNCRPQDWSLGWVSTCCCPCWVCSLTGLKQSDVQGECCLLYQHSCKEISPFTCCFWEGDLFPIAVKAYWPPDQDFENRDVPCLCNIGGCNICIDGQFRCAACQDIKTLKQGHWIVPGIPCVLGSCANCSLICECASACNEFCKKKNDSSVAAEASDDNKGSGQLPQADASAPHDIQPTKAEEMADRALKNAKETAMNVARSFGNGGRDQVGKTRMRDLKPCIGLICCMTSVNDKFPNCLGGFWECLFLVLNLSCACFQPMVERGDIFTGDKVLCIEQRLGCVCPRTLLGCQYTPPVCCGLCCFDTRAAIPCDGTDMPCILNIFGLNLCFKFRPTLGCTWYAPLGQFMDDYDGEKLTIFQMIWRCLHGCSGKQQEAVAIPQAEPVAAGKP